MDIRTTVRSASPRIPYEAIARDILGEKYELSLVICGDRLARRMNTQYRHKTYSPNVLSFPLDKNTGEIFLNVRKAEREAAATVMGSEGSRRGLLAARSARAVALRKASEPITVAAASRMAHLFIHGCLHLKGYDHSDAMDAYEHRMMVKYGFKI